MVWEAQTQSSRQFRVNATAASVDLAARTVIADAGYGDTFTHRVGHGIGIKGKLLLHHALRCSMGYCLLTGVIRSTRKSIPAWGEHGYSAPGWHDLYIRARRVPRGSIRGAPRGYLPGAGRLGGGPVDGTAGWWTLGSMKGYGIGCVYGYV